MLRRILLIVLLTPVSGFSDDIFTRPRAADVPQLIGHLENANLRQGASNALAVIGPPAVQPLIKALESNDLDLSIWAAYTLGKIGPEATSAAASLTGALKSSDKNLRAVAARSLGQIRSADKATIQALADALSDDDQRVRRYAATALGKIGPAARDATADLIGALADQPVRKHAIKAIIQIGSAATPALRAALGDNTIRIEAIEALREIDPDAARKAGVDKTSLDDLQALGMSIANTKKDTEVRVAHAAMLGQLGAKAAPLLIAVFDDQVKEVSRAASAAFGQIGADALPMLREALQHKTPQVRAAAADALAAIGPDAKPAVGDLGKALSDPDRSVRHRAAAALDKLGSVADEAVPSLIALMNNQRDLEATRQLAIKALAQTGPAKREQVIKALKEVQHRGNYGVRRLAEQMLQQIERP